MTNKQPKSRIICLLINLLAFTSLALGIIGIFLPILPTTPFILLTLWLFSKSSKRFHQALLNHRICGPAIKEYLKGKGIRKKYKIVALSFMWSTLIVCFFISVSHNSPLWLRIFLPVIGSSVSYIILKQPTYCEPEKNTSMTSSQNLETID